MNEVERIRSQINRLKKNYQYAYNWLEIMQEGTGLMPYFLEKRFEKIAIYGTADFGRMLYKELLGQKDIEVVCFMDKNAKDNRKFCDIPVYLPEEILQIPKVDAIIVTAIVAYPQISSQLLKSCPELPIISLQTIIDARMSEKWN